MFTDILAVLHPKYKLNYFRNAHWESSWIDTAQEMLRDEWNKFYKPLIDVSYLAKSNEATSKVSFCSDERKVLRIFIVSSKQTASSLSLIAMAVLLLLMFLTTTSIALLMPKLIPSNFGFLVLISLVQRLLHVVFWHKWDWITVLHLVSFLCLLCFVSILFCS